MSNIVIKECKGINATRASLQLDKGEVPSLQNLRNRPFSNWSKRPGIEPVSDSSDPIMGIWELEFDNIVIPIFQNGATLNFFADLTSTSYPYNDFYGVNGSQGSQGIDPAGVNTRIKGRNGPVSGGCVYALSSNSVTIDQDQQEIAVDMTTYIGCSWNAVSNDSFLNIISGSLSLSSGTCTVQAAANMSGMQRTGTVSFYRGSTGSSSLAATLTIIQTFHDPNVYNIDDYAAFLASLNPADYDSSPGAPSYQWDGSLINIGAPSYRYDWDTNGGNVSFNNSSPYMGFSTKRGGIIFGGANISFAFGEWTLSIQGSLGTSNVNCFTGHKVGGTIPAGVYTRDSGNCPLPTLTIV